jgi:hypothetical protein
MAPGTGETNAMPVASATRVFSSVTPGDRHRRGAGDLCSGGRDAPPAHQYSIESVLPASHPFVQIDHEIGREFGGRTMIVAIVPRTGVSGARIC